jgi:hypothetical protein
MKFRCVIEFSFLKILEKPLFRGLISSMLDVAPSIVPARSKRRNRIRIQPNEY